MKEIFFCEQLSIGDILWIRHEGLFLLPLSMLGPHLAHTYTGLEHAAPASVSSYVY